MNKLLMTILLSMISLCAFNALGQVTLGVGARGGTYLREGEDMIKVCGKEVTLSLKETKGSLENLQGLVDNTLTAGIVQFDVMRYFEDKEPNVSKIKVLMPLHVEEIHIVGVNKVYSEGGIGVGSFRFGAKAVELNSIRDLAGKKVIAWGGSVLSAEYFASKFKIAFEVIDITVQADAPAAAARMLTEGQAHAIFAVGGTPLGWLRNEKMFSKQFKLLSIPSDLVDQVKGTYTMAQMSYPNLTNGQVTTAGVQALLVVYDYRTGDRGEALRTLKQCIIANIDNLRDTPNMHPKWRTVEPSARFDRWANYNPPSTSTATKKR